MPTTLQRRNNIIDWSAVLKASHATIAEDLPYMIGKLTQQADAGLHNALLEMPRLRRQAEEWKAGDEAGWYKLHPHLYEEGRVMGTFLCHLSTEYGLEVTGKQSDTDKSVKGRGLFEVGRIFQKVNVFLMRFRIKYKW